MTREQAVEAFQRAVTAAIVESCDVYAAEEEMKRLGIGVVRIAVEALIVIEHDRGVVMSDEDFLRKLRIEPNLEVREG